VQYRHADYCLQLAKEASSKYSGPEEAAWLDRVDADHDNVRAALAWSLKNPESQTSLLICAEMWRFWMLRSHLSEGRAWCDAVLGIDRVEPPSGAYANVLNGAGALAHLQGDCSTARTHHERSLNIRREIGDTLGVAGSLNNLGLIAYVQSDYRLAVSLLEEARRINHELGNRSWQAINLDNLCTVSRNVGDYVTARNYCEQSVAIRRELGDKRGISTSLSNLGNLDYDNGDYAAARESFDQCLEYYRDIGDRMSIASTLTNIGNIVYMDDYAAAKPWFEEGLEICIAIGDKSGIAGLLSGLGNIAALQHDFAEAHDYYNRSLEIRREIGERRGIACLFEMTARLAFAETTESNSNTIVFASPQPAEGLIRSAKLWGAGQALRNEIDSPVRPHDIDSYNHDISLVKEKLGEEAWQLAWKEGYALPLEAAIELAMLKGSVLANTAEGRSR
jgi:tetratricopeptide (TPR) repeat protein